MSGLGHGRSVPVALASVILGQRPCPTDAPSPRQPTQAFAYHVPLSLTTAAR